MRLSRLLPILLLAAWPALAQEEGDVPPEPPLPPTPPEMPLAPPGPMVTAPDAAALLKECKDADFIGCFRDWKPPPPPPEEPKKESAKAGEPPLPPDPKAPREPAVPGGNYGGVPPAPNPAADQATYEALVKALKESGLDGKVMLPTPPKDGSTTLQLEPPKQKAPSTP